MTLRRPRPAFTLIELLIVMGIMVVIATLGFLFLPNLNKNRGVPNATTQLEGWVRLTKGQALRDGAPRGIRLVVDPNDPTKVTALQYIGQPDPIAPRGAVKDPVSNKVYRIAVRIAPWNVDPTRAAATLVLIDPTNNNTVVGAYNWDDPGNPQIFLGDFLELTASPDLVARIIANPLPSTLPGLTGPQRSTLVLDRGIPGTDVNPLILTEGFKVIRAAQPLQGEPLLQMHKDVFIDLTAPNNNIPLVNGNLDILFNYSGQVAHATGGMIFLTVQHVDRPTDKLVVVIYTRTGKVTAVNWDDISADPYSFARDGKGSGL